ncbi:MAG: hypothetical protein RL441_148 [Actinomycetota bacterium]|jgi:ABC-type lipoprotein export system ATPase subunit
MTQTAVLVSGQNLGRVFESPEGTFVALSNLSVEVRAHQMVALMGRSGSGKTTALNLLSGQLEPTSGSVSICGQELSDVRPEKRTELRRKLVGRIYQQFELFDELTPLENVRIALELRGQDSTAALERASIELDRVGLLHRLNTVCSRLSGGEQQRTAIARALACDPRILIADEPTGNLDQANALSVIQAFREAADRGLAVIVATHDPLFEGVADSIVAVSNS